MSQLYDSAKENFLSAQVNMTADTIIAIPLSASYSFSASAHKFISDLTGIVARSTGLTGKSVSAGVFDANDQLILTVTGSTVTQIALCKDVGDDATSPLIALVNSGTGLPIVPDGSNLLITWDNGANKIFRLTEP